MNRLSELLFPRRCPRCGEVLPFGAKGCACHSLQIRRIAPPVCVHCGAEAERCTCGRPGELTVDCIAAPFYYTGQVRDELLELKFRGERRLAKKLGREMALCFAERCADLQPDVVTWIPMTKKSERKRGFNQSALLAKQVAQQLCLTAAPLLEKTRETETQHTLGEEARKTNLGRAFALRKGAAVRGKTVLLVDDIKTTGATLSEGVRVLRESGAAAVCCLCCAITEYFTDQSAETSGIT